MRRAFEELLHTLAEFVEQDEHTLLVLRGTDAEMGYALKAIEAVEAGNEPDLFFAFPLPFQAASEWTTQVASLVSAQIDATNDHRAKGGQAPLPPFPLGTTIDVRITAEVRLRTMLQYLDSLRPTPEARLVIALLPVSIADFEGYATLVGSLAPPNAPPWASVRLLVRDSPDGSLARGLATRGLEVLSEDLKFSTAAMLHWLRVDAADTQLPLAERMSALLQLAMIDFSARRYEEALAKLRDLVPYFAREGPPASHALSLMTVGDISRAQGTSPATLRFALERYQQAAAVAMQQQLWPIVRNAVLGAGDVALALGHFADAESYFESAATISRGFFDTAGTIEARTRQGDAALARQRYGEAVTAWREASEIAEKVSDHGRHVPVLERLVKLYREGRQHQALAAAERALAHARRHASEHPHHAH